MPIQQTISNMLFSSSSLTSLKILTVGSIGLFAGQALAYNLIVMPALRTVSSETALPIWAKAYNIGKDTQVPLIGVSLLTGLAVHYKTQNAFFLLGPLLMASIIPYTLLVIMPVNRTLLNILDSNEKGKGKETNLRELYIKWDLLHFARTVLSISAFGLTLYGLCSPNTLLLTK